MKAQIVITVKKALEAIESLKEQGVSDKDITHSRVKHRCYAMSKSPIDQIVDEARHITGIITSPTYKK